jgi:CBS domain containing-hemolysin-like protein
MLIYFFLDFFLKLFFFFLEFIRYFSLNNDIIKDDNKQKKSKSIRVCNIDGREYQYE